MTLRKKSTVFPMTLRKKSTVFLLSLEKKMAVFLMTLGKKLAVLLMTCDWETKLAIFDELHLTGDTVNSFLLVEY
jgi:hypothetical protein